MEKVKLTREVSEALKLAVADYGSDMVMNEHYNYNWKGKLHPLNHLPQSTLSRALLIGYEVEEEYKSGDWVACEYEDGTWIAQIERIEGVKVFAKWELRSLDWNRIEDIRHATPEEIKAEQERRVWKKIGREVNEIRPGDCIASNGNYYKVFDNIGCQKYNNHISPGFAVDLIEGGASHGFYPAESFISFGGGEE